MAELPSVSLQRLHIKCSGNRASEGFQRDVVLLCKRWGKIATEKSHGWEHRRLVFTGTNPRAYVSIIGSSDLLAADITETKPLECASRFWTVEKAHPAGPGDQHFKTGTSSRELHATTQNSQTGVPGDMYEPGVILCLLSSPRNVGSVLRQMACLRFGSLVLVGDSPLHCCVAGTGRMSSKGPLLTKVNATSKGCGRFVQRIQQPLPIFLSYLERTGQGSRDPIVAVETSHSAVDINSFKWPERCHIMVGSEGGGISKKVMQGLRPGFDSVVIIPMAGPHKSLNVSTALAMAMFSYRSQWPGTALPMDM